MDMDYDLRYKFGKLIESEMDLPCIDCLILARCVNRDLYELWQECEQFSYFVRRERLTTAITSPELFSNTLILKDNKPILFFNFSYR